MKHQTLTTNSYSWIKLGNIVENLHLWTHACLSLDLTNGLFILIANGDQRIEGRMENVPKISQSINHVSVACTYRPARYYSIIGKVTDVQMFSGHLPDEEMEQMTGCQLQKKGDIISCHHICVFDFNSNSTPFSFSLD